MLNPFHAWRALRNAFRKHGGTRGLLRKIAEIYRLYGLAGVIRRVRKQVRGSRTADPFLVPHLDDAESKTTSFVNYLRHGAAEDLYPNADFDAAAHLKMHPKAPPMIAPSRQDWEALIARRSGQSKNAQPLVDVIVPVYRGIGETLRCLYTVLSAACTTPHAVIVVNDESPEPELVKELHFLADAGLIELLHNQRNGGFVATANRGMSLHADRDVVLLNSDTEVYGDWLDRLRAAAFSAPKIGSVTPLSNNAEICSYPFFVRDNDMALELDYIEIDRAAVTVNAGRSVPLPTAVGFCMYIRRSCLQEVGLFDVERFGQGYGEENDFCLRASARGWAHLLACDVFVRHAGGVSFGAQKQARIAKALALIDERFPHYGPAVRSFIEADPPREARVRLDVARLASRVTSSSILFVTHTWGGGIERHVQDLSRMLEAKGIAVFFLRPDPKQPHLGTLSHPDVWPTPNVGPFDLRGGLEPLVSMLREMRVRHMHVHSLVGFEPHATGWPRLLAQQLGVAYDITIHDYLPVCPRINLIDASGLYCGEPDIDVCERCVQTNDSPFGKLSVLDWRDGYGRLLRGARIVLVPGEDVAARIARYFPDLQLRVQPHVEASAELSPVSPARRTNGEALRVALIGAIGPHKGYDLLCACARNATERRLPIHFHLVGYSCDDAALVKYKNVTVTGRYKEEELPGLLAELQCHCAFFPSVWPETYSYTLSTAIKASLYPISFDLGVVADRIRKLGWGMVIPLTSDPAVINDALVGAIITAAPDWEQVRAHFIGCDSVVLDYYRLDTL